MLESRKVTVVVVQLGRKGPFALCGKLFCLLLARQPISRGPLRARRLRDRNPCLVVGHDFPSPIPQDTDWPECLTAGCPSRDAKFWPIAFRQGDVIRACHLCHDQAISSPQNDDNRPGHRLNRTVLGSLASTPSKQPAPQPQPLPAMVPKPMRLPPVGYLKVKDTTTSKKNPCIPVMTSVLGRCPPFLQAMPLPLTLHSMLGLCRLHHPGLRRPRERSPRLHGLAPSHQGTKIDHQLPPEQNVRPRHSRHEAEEPRQVLKSHRAPGPRRRRRVRKKKTRETLAANDNGFQLHQEDATADETISGGLISPNTCMYHTSHGRR